MRRLVERGATLVIVTHELAALADIVTRAVVVRGGQVVHDGPPADIGAREDDHAHHAHEDETPPSAIPQTLVPTKGGPR